VKELDAYAAGLIDGEGTITLSQNNKSDAYRTPVVFDDVHDQGTGRLDVLGIRRLGANTQDIPHAAQRLVHLVGSAQPRRREAQADRTVPARTREVASGWPDSRSLQGSDTSQRQVL
jgi:hypothetical protein